MGYRELELKQLLLDCPRLYLRGIFIFTSVHLSEYFQDSRIISF